MEMSAVVDLLTQRMLEFDGGDPRRIQHFIKVHRFAQLIGRLEQLDAHTQLVLECAALVHDIGIRPAEKKYGRCTGKLQEQEGPDHARRLMNGLGLEPNDIDRICYLVGHHHTYNQIDGIDYQILVEADLLVNFYEENDTQEHIRAGIQNVFRTSAGKRLGELLYFQR